MTAPPTDGPERPVSLLARWASALFARQLTFPPATHRVAVRRIGVPMRDGAELDADLYVPNGTSRATMLVRSPYDTRSPLTVGFALSYAERGFTVLNQSVRGTFRSEGRFDPMRQEARDGQDTVAWLRTRPWFDGRLVLTGASYLSWVQWALLTDPPPEVVAAVSMVGPHDLSRVVYRSGAMDLDNLMGWSEAVGHQEEHGLLGTLGRALTVTRRMRPKFAAFGQGRTDPDVLEVAPWFAEWASHPDITDPFWRPYDVTEGVQRTTAPTLVVAGWHDLFLEQDLEQHRILAGRGVPPRLVVGPWTHLDLVARAPVAWAESYRWLDRTLANPEGLGGERSVRLWVGGIGEWREYDRWPEHAATAWYLTPNEVLTPRQPAGSVEATFTYDPADPTPAVGGAVMSPGAGAADNRALERRADVLTFTSDPLIEPLTLIGEVNAEIDMARDNPNADLFVRLCDVDPRGRSVNLCDGIVRLTERDPLHGVVEVSLVAVAHRFNPGHRLRLLVAGGAFPRFSLNPGTGRLSDRPDHYRSTRSTVRLNGRSLVRLPVA